MTLTYDLVSKIMTSGAAYSLISFEVGIPNLVCGNPLGWRCDVYHFGHFDRDIDFDSISRFFVSRA